MNKEDAKEKVQALAEGLSNYFDKEEVEVGVVMSTLLTMCVHTMLRQGAVPPHVAIQLFTEAVCNCYELDNEGESEWLN
jgi:hypothetical protein